MALTAVDALQRAGFGPFAPEIYRAPMSYPYRDGLIDKGGPPTANLPPNGH